MNDTFEGSKKSIKTENRTKSGMKLDIAWHSLINGALNRKWKITE